MNNKNQINLKALCIAMLQDAEYVIANKENSIIDDELHEWKQDLQWLVSDEKISEEVITFLHCCRYLEIDPQTTRYDILIRALEGK